MSEDTGGFLHCQNKYSKSLSWAENLNKLFTVLGGKFNFSAQDSDLEYLFWQRKNSQVSSDLKPPLGTIIDGPHGTKGKEAFSPNSDVDCMVTLRATFVPSFSVKWSHYTTPLPTTVWYRSLDYG